MTRGGDNILLIHGGALGDFVLALHMAQRLREFARDTALHALCRSPFARCAVSRGMLDRWRDLEDPRCAALFVPGAAVDQQLADELRRATRVISMLGGPESPVAQQLQALCSGDLVCIDPTVRSETLEQGRHITEQWCCDIAMQFAARGLTAAWLSSRGRPSAGHPATPASQPMGATESGSPLICGRLFHSDSRESGFSIAARPASSSRRFMLHPGSGGRSKCWPLEQFVALGQRLISAGGEVRFMLGPVELDLLPQESIHRLERIAPIVVEPDLCGAAEAITRHCDVYIGNDAGMTHVAAALGVPTVAIFTATDPRVWRPIGPDVRTVQPLQADPDQVCRAIADAICIQR